MQLSDGIAAGEAGALEKGWYFTRKCDGWERSATYKNSLRMRFKGYLQDILEKGNTFEGVPLLPQRPRGTW
jgi:hypothetical protein